MRSARRWIVAFSLVAAVGCGGGGGGPDMGSDLGLPGNKAMLTGRIFNAKTNQPLAGVEIETTEGKVMTDSEGRFQILALAGTPTVAKVKAAGFGDNVAPLILVPDTTTYREMKLLPTTVMAQVDAAAGGTVEIPGVGAKVEIPPNALRTQAGLLVTGMVDVKITTVDPSKDDERAGFPGSFDARTLAGAEVKIEGVSVMEVKVTQGTEVLDVVAGMQLTLSLPAFNAPDSVTQIPFWTLDEETGKWVEEGIAIRKGDIFEAQVTHLSWFGGAHAPVISCVRGCVTSGGSPAVNAFLQVDAIGRSTGGSGFTGVDGCFAENVGAGFQYRLRASGTGGVAVPLTFTALTTPMTVQQNPSACMDLGTLALLPRTGTTACPDGSELCGTTCVDLVDDEDNCGVCLTSCRQGETPGTIFNAQCIGGTCDCPSNYLLCPLGQYSYCYDGRNDRNNCGACGNSCATGEACNAGTCQPIVCASGLMLCNNDCVDLQNDDRYCGDCFNSCSFEGGGPNPIGSECRMGACQCPVGEIDCFGTCSNTTLDNNNCGGCGIQCDFDTEVCNGGCNTIGCFGNEVPCARQCVDLQTDARHCGSCTNDCTFDGLNQICNMGSCECGPGTDVCEGFGCTDLLSNDVHCGACRNSCGLDETCVSGVCTPITCGGGGIICQRTCVDPMTDLLNCGGCYQPCYGFLSTTCNAGACTCINVGDQACPEQGDGSPRYTCITLPATCPAGNVAGPCDDFDGSYVLGGTCPYGVVNIDQMQCGATVTSSSFDFYFLPAPAIGSMLSFSYAGGSVQCTITKTGPNIGIQCTDSGTFNCTDVGTPCETCGGTTCLDLQTDDFHCGGCYEVCSQYQECVAGACEALVCPGPTEAPCFARICTDLATTDAHCGQCYNDCGVGMQCLAGLCEPNSP